MRYKEDYPSAREQAGIGVNIFLWVLGIVIAVALLGFLLTAFGLLTMPWVENKHTEIIHNTNQYITSTQTAMTNDINSYDNLTTLIAQQAADPANAAVIAGERGQQQGAVSDFCLKYGTLDKNFVTPAIQRFATQHPC